MDITNTITIIVGVIVLLFGIAAFFNPNWARWINMPGGPRLKAIAALFIGIIIIIIGFIIQIPKT
jgi:hypothetical protein